MKTWFWIVLAGFVALSVYAVMDSVRHARGGARRPGLTSDVGADSALAYQRRVADLEKRAADLRGRMETIGALDRPEVKARLEAFDAHISQLKQAIARWQVARGGDGPDASYRQCVILYGSARGICDALATDTLAAR